MAPAQVSDLRSPVLDKSQISDEDGSTSTESESLNAKGSAEKKRSSPGLVSWLVLFLLRKLRGWCSFLKPGKDMSVNARPLKVVRLLAEGGFSFVYLVEHTSSGERFALKKVLASDDDAVKLANWEVEVHSAFSHKHLMPLVDHCAIATAGQPTEFRLLMPLFGGSVHDRICSLISRGAHWAEAEILHIFAGILAGVAQFHARKPLAWSHRDIKPANVLLGDGDAPVLMDFGSTQPARVAIRTRTEALLLQEDAAQNCSMAYRAPELWDPPSECEIDERTDVWSLGCTLYAMAFYYSPFECTIGDDDLARVCDCSYLRVIGGLQFPKAHGYSPAFCELVRWTLTVDKDKRPFVGDVQARVRDLLAMQGHGAAAQWEAA